MRLGIILCWIFGHAWIKHFEIFQFTEGNRVTFSRIPGHKCQCCGKWERA